MQAYRVHISLDVTDLDRSVDFYGKLLGAEASKRKPGYANFRLDEPPLHLSLIEHRQGAGKRAGSAHFGIEVTRDDQLAAWRGRLQQHGIVSRTEEGETCCYAVSDKVWATDPDGREWEVWIRRADAEAMAAPAEGPAPAEGARAESASECCVTTGCCG